MGKGGRKSYPSRSVEGREKQLINLAVNLAEEKLRNGTASSQIITAFLNMGTTRYELENEKLKSDLRVAEAKIKSMENQSDYGQLLDKALSAFKGYQGEDEFDDYDD